MDTAPKCLRCSTTMEEGFIGDFSQGSVFVPNWVQGKPERSFWTVTKTRDRVTRQVRTFRCPNCGYLESYADA